MRQSTSVRCFDLAQRRIRGPYTTRPMRMDRRVKRTATPMVTMMTSALTRPN